MVRNLKSIAVLAFAMIFGFSDPAYASPKTDCKKALQQVETDLNNRALDRSQKDRVRRSLVNARQAREDGKYKQCMKILNNMKKQWGIK